MAGSHQRRGAAHVTIVTTEPNALMARIHTRMPMILPGRAAEMAWLDDGLVPAAHQSLLLPHAADQMPEYVVSTLVNSSSHNDPTALLPAA